MTPARENDEKSFTCNSPDLIARLGANRTFIQGRGRASRQLYADRPDRRRQTGLFDEVREFAGPPPSPPQAETREVPAQEPEVQRSGIFAGPMRERDRANRSGFSKNEYALPGGPRAIGLCREPQKT
jgi:hypothetical protein